MDIAEIRKKAKARSAGGTDQESGKPEERHDEERPAVADAVVASESDSDSCADPGVDTLPVQVTQPETAENEALDRLFAGTDALSLATDESYAELLEDEALAQSSDAGQYLAFRLDDEEYALDIKQISEIIKVREFTDIPRSPGFILGIISLRGVVVPVFDLRCRLNLGVSELLPTSRIVVCQFEDLTIGLLVDSINQVVNLVDDDIEPPPGVLSGLDREMVYGIGRFQGRMIILLHLQNVLTIELNEERRER